MSAAEYVQWYYLIYLLPGGAALLVLLLSALGGGHHHGGLHHQVGDLHQGALPHSHVPGDAGHSVHNGQPGGHETADVLNKTAHAPAAAPDMGHSLLALFGIGRLPALFIWGSFLLGWAVFGFWGTQFWQAHLRYPVLFALPSLVVALGGALATARATAALGMRLLPQEESTAISTVGLCGQTGTVVFPVDESRGRVHIYDQYGTMHDVTARAAPGQGTIARDRKILATDYDAARDQLIVEEVV